MAQPTNTFDSYDANGIREDLSDVIANVDAEETPFYSACSKTKASNTLHEWQTDSLRSSAANAHIEGDDTTADVMTATTRLNNRTQIFKNAVIIPGTDIGLNKAGRGKEMAYQIVKVAKEQRLDIEKALFDNNAAVAGDGSTARELAGVPAWIYTNDVHESGNSGASPTGNGTDARTDDGTPVAFTQARFDTAMQNIWSNSNSAPGTAFDVYLSAYQMNVALGFTGMNNQRSTVKASDERVINHYDVYVTPWGTVTFKPSRENRSRDVLILKPDMWKVAVLRGMKQEDLSKTGDSQKKQVVCELTLESSNEKASGGVFDNTTS